MRFDHGNMPPIHDSFRLRSRRMRTIIVIALVLVLLGTQPSLSLAQDKSVPPTGTWEAVKAIPPGENLEVKLKTGKTVKGTLTSVTDTGVNLGRGSDAVSIGRDEVRRVFHAIKESSGKPALVGAAVGAAIGAGILPIEAAVDGHTGSTRGLLGAAAFLGLVGAGAGALVGSIFRNRKKLVLIYESQ